MDLRVVYVASQELAKVSSLLPSNPKRSLVVHSLVASLGLLKSEKGIRVVHPARATFKDLACYHTRDYLEFVLDPKNALTFNEEYGIEGDCPPFTGLNEYVSLVAGASLTAVNVLIRDLADISICWDGGRHHANKSRAAGFCYVADCILAILALKRSRKSSSDPHTTSGKKPRIFYLDLDLHFSDAVAEAFATRSESATPQILTLSVHHASPGFFSSSSPLSQLPAPPYTDPFTLSLPLKPGASPATLARIWPAIEWIKDAFQPDYTVVQCGTDAFAEDPCATFNYSLEAFQNCVRQVLHAWPGKKLLLGGGGYHTPNTARAWAALTAVALDKPLPLDTPIPDHDGFPLYAPSFTLDVPAGTMQDQNTEEYLAMVEDRFAHIADAIKVALGSQSDQSETNVENLPDRS